MIKVIKLTYNNFAENTYICYDQTKDCIIIDPGCFTTQEEDHLAKVISENNLTPVKVLHTHSHLDHVFGTSFVLSKYNIELYIHKEDRPTLDSFKLVADFYGIPLKTTPPKEFKYINVSEGVDFGDSHLDVRFVPGHAPGHIVFICNESKFVINGDCLFDGSIGRTDLPGGNHEILISSIKSELFSLDDDYLVYTGHGPETTIGKEKATNPFF